MEGHPLRALCTLVVVLAVGSYAFAPTRTVDIYLPARMAFAPVDLHFRVRIEPSPANRAFDVTAWCDGDPLYSTARQLDGSEPPSHWLVWKGMEACDYEIRATLFRADGTTVSATVPFEVKCSAFCD